MDRKQAYDKIKELGLQEVVKEKFKRNFTQVPTAELEAIINEHLKAKETPKPKKEEPKKEVPIKETPAVKEEIPIKEEDSGSIVRGSIESKFAKLVEMLAKRRILLPHELDELANA